MHKRFLNEAIYDGSISLVYNDAETARLCYDLQATVYITNTAPPSYLRLQLLPDIHIFLVRLSDPQSNEVMIWLLPEEDSCCREDTKNIYVELLNLSLGPLLSPQRVVFERTATSSNLIEHDWIVTATRVLLEKLKLEKYRWTSRQKYWWASRQGPPKIHIYIFQTAHELHSTIL